jgi:ATP-dependent Clp protease ATP-binding subunit ClpC
MFERFTPRARRIIIDAQQVAKDLGHPYIGTEHMVLGMLSPSPTETDAEIGFTPASPLSLLLSSFGVTPDSFRDYVLTHTPSPSEQAHTKTPPFSVFAKRAMELALREALSLGDSNIAPDHLLLGMLLIPECEAMGILVADYRVNLGELRDTLLRTRQNAAPDIPEPTLVTASGEAEFHPRNAPSVAVGLDYYGTNLTQRAREGALDPVAGRYNEIERVTQVLTRRSKNNPILIGEPGVGKTAIIEGLAQAVASGNVPAALLGQQIYSIDLGKLIAGARYRGDFEERFKKLLAEVQSRDDVIIFLDEIHVIIGAGSAEGSIDAASLLKPLLSRGQLRVIGATTPEEYRKHFERDAALSRRFQSVAVDPPSVSETIDILRNLRPYYESHHRVLIDDSALVAAAELSERYVADRFLPDKAIDLIDEAGSRLNLDSAVPSPELKTAMGELLSTYEGLHAAKNADDLATSAVLAQRADDQRAEILNFETTDLQSVLVNADVVAAVLSAWTKIPLTRINAAVASQLMSLEADLSLRIIAQDEAITALAQAVRRSRAGMRNARRPAGSFIFLGPSGVGKTELAKALAELVLGDREAITMLDMSEYMEKHSVSRLVGSPPGYVGYEEAGQLTEAVRRKPFSVILFDEIEKAHPEVFHTLLQVLEEGHLTDARGRVVDFSNTFIVMTSNLGTEAIARQRAGFSSGSKEAALAQRSEKAYDALKGYFRPEFLNRIDEIILFNDLTTSDLLRIVDLLLEETQTTWPVVLTITSRAREFIVEHGHDKDMGARPLRRAITRYIENPLADLVISGALAGFTRVDVDVAADNLSLVLTPVAAPALTPVP